uniref:Cytochrome P450 6j1 n=1 Tax=Cacopsylla melanoneura TaxID=428564 RepID=A0A8D9F509_9HEMI
MGSVAFTVWAIFITALLVLYKWATSNVDYWKKRKFPFIRGVPLLGNYVQIVLGTSSISDLYRVYYNQMKDVRYFGILIGTKPALLVKDPELVMRIMIKDFRYFYDRGFSTPDKDFIGNNLFFQRNPKWKVLRGKIVTVFSSAKLKSTFQIIDKCTDDLIEYLHETITQEKNIPTRELMGDAMTDVVCKAICGIQIHTLQNPNKEHVEIQKMVFGASARSYTRNIVNFFSPDFLAKKINNFSEVVEAYFCKLTWQAIELRKKENVKRSDLLQLLMDAYEQEQMLPEEKRVLGREELVASIFIMILAGYETSTSTSSLVLHELAYEPEVQEKVRNEVRKVALESGGKIKYEDLSKLKYLEQVISETLRLYPLTNTLFRECMEDFTIPGTDHVIEKGVFIHIPTSALHTDPNYWKDPETFDPDRFSEQNESLITPGSYLPFGDGPRICIGKRFAFLQLKLVLSKVLVNYHVSPCEKTKRHYPLIKNSMLAVPEGVCWLKFTRG